jgi:hypothetical protein
MIVKSMNFKVKKDLNTQFAGWTVKRTSYRCKIFCATGLQIVF